MSQKVGAPQGAGIGTAWSGDAPVFAFGDGLLRIGTQKFRPHDGGILAMAHDPVTGQVVTCGDDGRVMACSMGQEPVLLYQHASNWLDLMAFDPVGGVLAVGAGRRVILCDARTPQTPAVVLDLPRAATALAFNATGSHLAMGHSQGVRLVDMADPLGDALDLPCAGGPISVAMDASAGFLFAGLSEPALAGWRLRDGQGFRMGGYPAKPRQLVWDHTGTLLLTSGGPALLVWPLTGKEGGALVGPMGQAAGVYRPRLGLVTAVASVGTMAAIGWSDGGVDVVDLTTNASRHIGGPRPPKTLTKDPRTLTRPIISVALRGDGKQVSWINEAGVYSSALVSLV
ncbi:MAG: hypothetical protein RLZZ157_788 [Pseudomonadota bacterium]|jgi:hypothetical protein